MPCTRDIPWVRCPGCVPAQDLSHPQPKRVKGEILERQCWCCASSAQQEPKRCCGISTLVAKTLLWHQHPCSYRRPAQHWELPWAKLTPPQPGPRYLVVVILKHCTTRSSENKQFSCYSSLTYNFNYKAIQRNL